MIARDVSFFDRLTVATYADELLEAGRTVDADKLLDAVRCCGDFPECLHVAAWAEDVSAALGDCPNGPDEDGYYPCDPKGYFGVAECQVCGRIGKWAERTTRVDTSGLSADAVTSLHNALTDAGFDVRPRAANSQPSTDAP